MVVFNRSGGTQQLCLDVTLITVLQKSRYQRGGLETLELEAGSVTLVLIIQRVGERGEFHSEA